MKGQIRMLGTSSIILGQTARSCLISKRSFTVPQVRARRRPKQEGVQNTKPDAQYIEESGMSVCS
jgi:hypothetical protein